MRNGRKKTQCKKTIKNEIIIDIKTKRNKTEDEM